MRSLLRFVLLALIVFVIVGFMRGWFTVNSSSSPIDSDKVDVSFTVDKEKMRDDATKANDKAHELANKAVNKAK